MKHVLAIDDLIPLTHRAAFAVCFGALAALSYVSSPVRKHMAPLTYALGCAAVLNMLLMGTQAEFDAGSIVALLLIVPIMNALFYHWRFLLYANLLLLLVIVSVFARSNPNSVEALLFLLSSAVISGGSFWFSGRLVTSEAKSAVNERMFQDLFRHSMEGIAMHEMLFDGEGEPADYVFLEVNPAFEAYTGLHATDILGKTVTTVLPGIEDSGFIEKYGRVVRTGKPLRFEQFSDPLQRHYRVSAYPVGGNRFVTTFEDTTQNKQAELELRRSQELYQQIVDTQQEMICRFRPDTTITFANPAFRQRFALTDEDIYRQRLLDLLPQEQHAAIRDHLQRLAAGEPCVPDERPVVIAGRTYWQRWQDYPLFNEHGEIQEFQSVSYDITDLKLAMTEKDSAQKTIEQLHQVALKLAKARSKQEVCQVTLQAAEDILSFDLSGVGLIDGEWLRVQSVSNKLKIVDVPRTIGLAGCCLEEGRSIITADAQADPRANPLRTSYRGVMSIPIGGRGVFQAVSYSVNAFSQEDVRLAELLVSHTLAALERLDFELGLQQREKQLAERDQLLSKLSQQVPGAIYQYRYHPNGTSYFPFTSEGIWDIYEVRPDHVKHDAAVLYSRIHPEDRDRVAASIHHSYEALTLWNDEYRVVLPEKGLRWVRGLARPERLPDGSVLWHGYLTDVTEMKAIETALQDSELRYKSLVTNVPGVIFQCRNDAEWTMEYLGQGIEDISGYPAEEFIANQTRSYASIIHTDDVSLLAQTVAKCITHGNPCTLDYRIVHADGSIRWINENVQAVTSTAGEVLYLYGVITDVTEQKQMDLALRESEERFRQIAETIGEVFWLRSADNAEVIYINPAYETVWGRSCESLYKNPESFLASIYEEDQPTVFTAYERYSQTGDLNLEFRIRQPAGEIRWVHVQSFPVRANNGSILRHAGLAVDITERKQAEQEIEYLSFHDALTGLYNRRFFEAELTRLDVPRNLPLTLCVIDVNGLKLINDAFGHQAGDELLKTAAKALKSACRADDILARIGGDEFAVILPHSSEKQADTLTQRIHHAVGQDEVKGLPVSVAVGWGVKTDQQETLADVFRTAEDNMYQRKTSERSSRHYQSVNLIMQTLYAKSPREQAHSHRVSQLCEAIGTAVGLSQGEVNELSTAAMLHDIGKVAISDAILDKVPPLTDAEWAEMKTHPTKGYNILSSVNDYGPLAAFVLAHHERWDGAGYPRGLKKEAIPLSARIIAIADTYDAMTCDRPYRSGMDPADALEEIEACAGFQFDPNLVAVFLKLIALSRVSC